MPLSFAVSGTNDVGNGVGNNVQGIVAALNETETNALKTIGENPRASAQVISESLGISKRQAERTLSSLRDKGCIEREESTRGYWVIRR